MPLTLSIVTPCYNRADFIVTAIASVRAQWRDGMEHIIVDGGSTDGTLDILKRHPHLTVICEPDENLYDAVNKGVRRARGNIIGWLNTDDRYLDGAFDVIFEAFENNPTADLVCGGARLVTHGAEDDPRKSDLFNADANKNLDFSDILFDVPVINARFFRREVFDRIGLFHLHYMPAADREFLLRCARAGLTCTAIDRVVHEYVLHDGSATIRSGMAHWHSMARVHMDVAEAHLKDPDIPAKLRRALRRFHAKNALIGAVSELSQGHLGQGAGFVARGWAHHPLWPALALYHSLTWAQRGPRQA